MGVFCWSLKAKFRAVVVLGSTEPQIASRRHVRLGDGESAPPEALSSFPAESNLGSPSNLAMIRAGNYLEVSRMIFENGELRPAGNNKPMLFEGWDYVPMELSQDALEKEGVVKRRPTASDLLVAELLPLGCE